MSMIQSVRGAVLCLGLVCVVGACGSDPKPASNNAPVVYTGGAPAVGATGGAPGAGVGTTGGAPAGTGGAPAGTGGAPVGTGGMMAGGTPDAACVTAVKTAQMNMGKAGCAECVCLKDPMAGTKCDMMCWALLSCIGSKCAGVSTDTACIIGMCAASIGGATMAMTVGMPVMACKAECTM